MCDVPASRLHDVNLAQQICSQTERNKTCIRETREGEGEGEGETHKHRYKDHAIQINLAGLYSTHTDVVISAVETELFS